MVQPGLPLAHSQERIDHDPQPQHTDIRISLTPFAGTERSLRPAWHLPIKQH